MPSSRSTESRSVVSRIVADMSLQIQTGALPAGAKLPSVRQLARERGVSAFSAAEIYNALVATGTVEARPGTGYFVPNRFREATPAALYPEFSADSVWERRRETQGQNVKVDAGAGWLPSAWLHTKGVQAALRAVARQPGSNMEGYGNPFGLPELRALLVKLLEPRGIAATEQQIVLTQGASQALDLVVRQYLAPGDVAIVEDPGYPPLFEMLKDRGAQMLSVPRTQHGPDVEALAQLLKRRRARVLFTNTTAHNPTGTTTNSATAHRILELAAQHGLTVVEDDIFAELSARAGASLASLDQLERVIYLSSFSKTISPGLRAGYVAAAPAVAQKLARAKVMSSLGSSELLEQIVLHVLTDGRHRRHVRRLAEQLADAHVRVQSALETRGVELGFRAQPGLFLWAKLPSREPVSKLWRMALNEGVLLAPGELFSPEGRATPYWRFNVAQCDAPALYRFLDAL